MKPVVAIIGRPNVGKSTIFNRITRSRAAIVDDMPGVTRDRHYGEARWNDMEFTLVDTGGYLIDDEDEFAAEIRFQVAQAIENADAIIMVLDGKAGISPFDADVIALLRNALPPVFYAVNKIDSLSEEGKISDFYELGLEHLYPVSGEHGFGMNDLLDDLTANLIEKFPLNEEGEDEDDSEKPIHVAVVGRPNVGKSSLINKILNEKRLVVSDVAGTTRDSIDTLCRVGGREYLMIDTAGIRRRARVSEKLEKFSVLKTLKSLERCDVALILIDSSEGVTEQDITIAGYAHERGCGCIFVFNKWDLVEKDTNTIKEFTEDLRYKAKFLGFAPVAMVSAVTGQRVPKIFEMIREVHRQFTSRSSTSEVNKIIEYATERREPPFYKGKRVKIFYATQVSSKPPTFVIFVNFPGGVHFSYERYLSNQLRDALMLDQTPIKLLFREKTGRIDFAAVKNEKYHSKNKDDRTKFSRNKEKKKTERKDQARKKIERASED